MPSRPILLAVMLSMLLQAASIGGLWNLAAQPCQTLHALLHWVGLVDADEPRHGRGPVGFEAFAEQLAAATQGHPQDASTDTYHYLGVDAWLHALALTPAEFRGVGTAAAGSPPELAAEAAPTGPIPESPRRPPKALG